MTLDRELWSQKPLPHLSLRSVLTSQGAASSSAGLRRDDPFTEDKFGANVNQEALQEETWLPAGRVSHAAKLWMSYPSSQVFPILNCKWGDSTGPAFLPAEQRWLHRICETLTWTHFYTLIDSSQGPLVKDNGFSCICICIFFLHSPTHNFPILLSERCWLLIHPKQILWVTCQFRWAIKISCTLV